MIASPLFFFSSRRRHTRYIGDWSSDVCSSDLPPRSRGVVPVQAAQRDLGGLVEDGETGHHLGELVGQVDLLPANRGDDHRRTRSEERRVGKECRSERWEENHKKKYIRDII